ncbi:MAG: hypothetical protein KC501_17335 [Myxococcales bacterium]|nr:hypothetical protein [Myxococcales bacterium]
MSTSAHPFPLEHEPPYLIRITMAGDFDGDAIHALFDEIDQLIGEQPFWLFHVDISELGHASPSARRAGAERIGKTPGYSLVLYGGGLAQRAVSTLFLKVAELFSGGREVVTKFAKDRDAADEWIAAEQRRREAAPSG